MHSQCTFPSWLQSLNVAPFGVFHPSHQLHRLVAHDLLVLARPGQLDHLEIPTSHTDPIIGTMCAYGVLYEVHHITYHA